MKKLRIRYPVWVSIGLTALFLLSSLLGSIPLLIWPGMMEYSEYLAELVAELVALLVMTLATLVLGMGDTFWPSGRPLREKLLPCAALLIFYTIAMLEELILCIGQPVQSGARIVFFVLCMLAVGVTEELVFRGLITRMLYEKYGHSSLGVWFSVLISSLLFGAVHMTNAAAGIPTAGVAVQMGAAACMGICLSAIYLRSGSLWPVALLHGYMDFCALISSGVFAGDSIEDLIGGYSIANLIAGLGYAAIGIFLLRPSKMRKLTGGRGQFTAGDLVKLMVVVALFSGLVTAIVVLSV